ncbi:hypothetical protein BH23BAC1_BH23BAC1_36970 [soil metagenome]
MNFLSFLSLRISYFALRESTWLVQPFFHAKAAKVFTQRSQSLDAKDFVF